MDAIVFPLAPRVLVYYCGSNDINAGASSRDILGNFSEWSRRAREKLPGVKIAFVSINRAPQKRPLWPVLDETNERIAAHCNESGRGLHSSTSQLNLSRFWSQKPHHASTSRLT
jgi:hypothetical protein